jgi:putative selenate reductase
VAERRDFDEFLQTLTPDAARREASRCVDCHVLCSQCVAVCPNLAFMTYREDPLDVQLSEIAKTPAGAEVRPTGRFKVDQSFQVAVLADFCNECGNCVTFCPTSGEPYRDKPRIYLARAEFEAQADNAFRFFRDGDAWAVQARWSGSTHELEWDGALTYSAPGLTCELDPDTLAVRDVQIDRAGSDRLAEATLHPEADSSCSVRSTSASVSLEPCAIMYALLRGVRNSLAHVPTATGKSEVR